jgi:hypothetical protein
MPNASRPFVVRTRTSGLRRRFAATLPAALIAVTAPLAGVALGAEPAAAPPPATETAAPPTTVADTTGTPPPAAAPQAPAAPPAPAATTTTTAPPPGPPPAPPPPPYSLPWQLRPVAAANVVRADTAVALYKNPTTGNAGSTVATMLTASYKVLPGLAPMLRLGFAQNSPPEAAAGATTPASGGSFVNPVVGATYAKPIGLMRLAGFLGVTIPIGMGGGDTPDAGAALANSAGISARSAMDNAMFAVNYMTVIGGLGAAYVSGGFTAQVEATIFQLTRVRGDNAASATDSSRTNSTAGLHVGYFVVPMLSLGAELRYQRWLSTPTTRTATGLVDIPDVNKETVTVAFGPRFHFKLGKTSWLRPGIAYARALDKPLTNSSYNMVQVDLPFAF